MTSIPSADVIGSGDVVGGITYTYKGDAVSPSGVSPFYVCDGLFAKSDSGSSISVDFGKSYRKNRSYLTPKDDDLVLWSDVGGEQSQVVSQSVGAFFGGTLNVPLSSAKFGPFNFSRVGGESPENTSNGYVFVLRDGRIFYAEKTGTDTHGSGDDALTVPTFTLYLFSGASLWSTGTLTGQVGTLVFSYDDELIPGQPYGQWILTATDAGELVEDQTGAQARGNNWSFLDAENWDQNNLLYAYPEWGEQPGDVLDIESIHPVTWFGTKTGTWTTSVTCDFTPGTYVPKVIDTLAQATRNTAMFRDVLAAAIKHPQGFTVEIPFAKLDAPEILPVAGQVLFFNGENWEARGANSVDVITIPAATTEITLVDGGAYVHVPSISPIYTLPDVSDETRTHEITIEVEFSASALAIAFLDEDGGTVSPLPMAGEIAAGVVVCYYCRWSPGLEGWAIMPVLEGSNA